MTKYSDIEIETAQNLLEHDFMWIVRNKNGKLFAHFAKPSKVNDFWASVGFGTCVCNYVPIFQSIRFDDKEPVNLESIVHPQILDDVERKYLSAVIKPFRNKVKSISKGASEANQEFIVIDCKNGDETFLPWFKAGTMYKGMERYKKYTLEELGL